MKRFLKVLLIVSAMTMMFAMPASAAVKTSVKVLNVGKSYTISNTSKVTSSKKSVATAKKKSGSKFKITAKKKGISTLKVYNKKGKQTKKIYLFATNSNSFKYSTSTVNLAKGKTKTVKGTSNISGVTVKYSSSNSNVATVNSSGKITAKKAGSATISAKFYYKGIKAKTVKKKVNVYTSSYNTDSISLTEGKTKTVSASVSSNCTAKYSSSNTSVAKVNSSGKITAVKKGTTTITCKVYLGSTNVKTYTKKVTVNTASSSNNSASFTFHTDCGDESLPGGRYYDNCVWCEKKTDFVTIKLSNDCLELTDISDPVAAYDNVNSMNAYYTYFETACRKEGKCQIGIYVNNVLKKTVTVTVTSTDNNYYIYEDWKAVAEKEVWTSDMSKIEKVVAMGQYTLDNYDYGQSCGRYSWPIYGYGNCIASADLVIDVAHDLGLEAEFYLTTGSWADHVYAYVWDEDGTLYGIDASRTGTHPRGYVNLFKIGG